MNPYTSPPRGRLGPADVGFRVVLRQELPTGAATDILGVLLAWGPEMLVVCRADGTEVRVEARSLRAAKRVPPGPARLRSARPGDGEAIEALRLRCWSNAYRGMVPDTYLDALPAGLRAGAARREPLLAEPPTGARQLVADPARAPDGCLVGWVSGGPSRDADRAWPAAGEIYACYVDPRWSGVGIGGRLLRRLLDSLATDGLTDVALWVLAANQRATRFYASHGFAPDGSRQILDLGGPVPEIRMLR